MQPTRTFVCTCQHAHDRHAIKHAHTHAPHTGYFFPQVRELHSKYSTNHEHEREDYFWCGEVDFRINEVSQFPLPKTSPNDVQVVRCYSGSRILCVGCCLRLGHLRLSSHHDNDKNTHTQKKNPDVINDKRLKITPDHLSGPRKCNDDNEDEDALRY